MRLHSIADQLAKGTMTMSFTRWLSNLRSAVAPSRTGRKHRQRPVRTTRRRPDLEALEDRCLMSFSPAVIYPAGAFPNALVTADFNNDARPDLAVANSSGGVIVLLGNAGGTF